MSWTCKDCHAGLLCDYHDRDLFGEPWTAEDPRVSFGPCEDCKEDKPCVNCGAPRKPRPAEPLP